MKGGNREHTEHTHTHLGWIKIEIYAVFRPRLSFAFPAVLMAYCMEAKQRKTVVGGGNSI